jgi:hypothetical protein
VTAKKLPKPIPAHVPAVRTLDVLAPRFRTALERVLMTLTGIGLTPMVVETLRTSARQQHLYGFGRTHDDGRGIVTHSRDADETWHGFGLAADVVCARTLYAAPPEFWAALGRACARERLTWGGDWNGDGSSADERFLDRPHIQWGPPMRRSPSPRAARLVELGGMAALWKEVGAG